MELHIPLKITNNIFLLPRRQLLDEKNYSIGFNKDEYIFILIESKEEIEDKQILEKKVKIILTILSVFFCNQFYYKEYYYIKKEINEYEILEARIIPFPTRSVKKAFNYLFSNALGIQRHFGDIIQELLNHPLSDSLFHLTATLMACLKEDVFETSAILAWNFLEHLAARYWSEENKDFLLKLKSEKYKEFKQGAVKFNKENVQDDYVLLTGEHSRVYDITDLLISNNISPVKYRIFSMFEKKDIFEDKENDKDKIRKLYKIRNKLMHYGSSLEEIRSSPDINFNPTNFVITYKPFIYQKFLKFLNIVDKYAEFRNGKLILKDDMLEEYRTDLDLIKEGEKKGRLTLSVMKLSAEDVNKNLPLEKVDILDNINTFLEPFQNLTTEGTLEWNSNKANVVINLKYDNNEFTLKMNNPPIKYSRYLNSSRFHVKGDKPEDNIQMIDHNIIKFNYSNYVIHVLFFENVIKWNIDEKDLYGFEKSGKEEQYLIFKIEEIQVNPT